MIWHLIYFAVFTLIRKINCNFFIYSEKTVKPTLSSLGLIKTIEFKKLEVERLYCIGLCQRKLYCDLVAIEAFQCRFYRGFNNVSFLYAKQTSVFVKKKPNFKFLNNEIT